MGRPAGTPNKDKPFRDAIRMEEKELAAGNVINHHKGSLRWNAQRLLMDGTPQSMKEVGDRLDGKPAQAIIGGDDDDPDVKVAATVIQRTIVDPRNPDSSGSSPAT